MPRPLRTSGRLLSLALACAVSGAALAEESASPNAPAPRQAHRPSTEHTPAEWLERMNQALNNRNYDGTFSHWQGGQVEMLRIIHRLQDGVVSERLASLDGSGREFIRTGSSLTCYLPDKRTVLVEQRPAEQSLVGFLPTVNAQTASFYDIREAGHTRLNHRDTHVITVTPKDEYRYGYRLWIDELTAMPLKSQLCDSHGRVIEQIVFASLTLSPHLGDVLFKPEVSTAGFQWLRNDAAPQLLHGAAAGWDAMQLPPGFRMTVRSAEMLPGSTGPVDHVVFTDGFATVSVFVERQPDNGGAVITQFATVGSSSAYSTVANGQKITAVGEVPPATVEYIASQVQAAQGASPVGARGR